MSSRRTRQQQRRLTHRPVPQAYRRGPSRVLINVTMMTLGVLLVAGGIAAVHSGPRPVPPPPVAAVAVHWRQVADSCIGIVTARSALTRPVVLELTVTDTAGGLEVTPEESFDRIAPGQSLAFTLYKTACRTIVGWRLGEQPRRLPDPVPPPSQMEY